MQRFPRWLSWIILIFLGYIIVSGNLHRSDAPPRPAAPVAQQDAAPRSYPKLDALMNGERWKKALDPDYKSPDDACAPSAIPDDQLGNYAIIREDGTGEPVACGATAMFSVTLWNNAGKAARTIDDLTLTLGEQKDLDALIVGMKPGEERLLLIRPAHPIKAILALKANAQQLLTITYTPAIEKPAEESKTEPEKEVPAR